VVIAVSIGSLLAIAGPVGAEQYLILKNGVEHLGRAGEKDRFITCRGAVLSMRDATLKPTKDKCPNVQPTMPKGATKVPSAAPSVPAPPTR
jgi:hypothetical protein